MNFRSEIRMGSLALCLVVTALSVRAQTLLEADGVTDTYELIESILGSGTADETPDCAHPEFGPHITQTWDDAVGKYVFSFFIHVTPDNDRCIEDVLDRQRNEIKTKSGSPAYLVASQGEATAYHWYFKLDEGFQPSPKFTHIHQIKADNAGLDDAMPLITITPRAGSPEKLQLLYAPPIEFGGTQSEVASADLSLFKGQWVEASEQILNATNGTYELTLKRVSDGTVLLSYTNSSINMWRGGDSSAINRPKWGIYRSITNTITSYLRDEEVRFADFCLMKGGDTCPELAPFITTSPTNQSVFWGAQASFTAAATGTLPLRYQWQFNATNLPGATNAAVVLSHVQNLDEGDYSVVVSNAFGVVASAVASLTVSDSATDVFSSSGTWVCPEGITLVQVECWGGGGAGGSALRIPNSGSSEYGGGGAGGAYARYNLYPVSSGNTYYVHVGEGGQNSSTNNDTTVPGGDSWFNAVDEPSTDILAKGGAGGESAVGNSVSTRNGVGGTGTDAGSIGDVVYAGGSGATGNNDGALSFTGGGGSSAGTGSAGNSATNNVGAEAPFGGGDGGTGPTTSSGNGGDGMAPGGGGSGARDGTGSLKIGGAGGAGKVVLTYAVGTTASNISAVASAPVGNGSGPGGLTTYAQRTRITLTETPSAGSAPFTYAWKKVGSDTVLGTESTLGIDAPVDGDQYTCDVAAVWDGVTNTSPTASLTVTTAVDPAKVIIIKADDFRASNWSSSNWTNFLVASRALGIKVNPGVVVTGLSGNTSIMQWMQEEESVGDVEFWNHGWDHSQWLDGGTTVYEFSGSGLEFQQTHLTDSQADLASALGHDVLAFGTPYNQFDTNTMALINGTAALRLFFTTSVITSRNCGLDSRVEAVKIYGESPPYGDGTGMPNAAAFIAYFPDGPPGPAALQFHPGDSNFNASRVAEYEQIVQFLLSKGYVFLLSSEYIASRPVSASFLAAPTGGGALLTVTFSDTSTGTVTNRFWDFGDGTTTNTSLTGLQHIYRVPGTSTVSLVAGGADGLSTNIQSGLIVATSVDSAGDGVPDWWRAQYFGGDGSTTNADSSAESDFDHDGLTNLGEYLADTVPTNAASRLALTGLNFVGNQVQISWIGGSDAWQSVESRTSLADTNDWLAVYINIPPTTVSNILLQMASSNGFYRIKAWR